MYTVNKVHLYLYLYLYLPCLNYDLNLNKENMQVISAY